MNYNLDFSLLVLCYNPNRSELIRTLKSILLQKEVSYEIVIADDGSSDPLKEDIISFFKEANFDEYKLDFSQVNCGTVSNISRGLIKCTGKYIKLISPGDFLCDFYSLKNMYDVAENTNAALVFSEVIYFEAENISFKPLTHFAHPQLIKPYINGDQTTIKKNYLLLNDALHGVSTIVRNDILAHYIGLINGKIKYCEDLMYRLMVAENVRFAYAGFNAICYSFGTGISTSKKEKWNKLIHLDELALDQILFPIMKNDQSFIKKYQKSVALRNKPSIINKISFAFISPGSLFSKAKIKFHKRYTNCNVDEDYIKMLFD